MAPDPAAVADLLHRFGRLKRALARHVARLRATGRFVEDPFRGLFVGEAEVDAVLAAEPWAETEAAPDPPEATLAVDSPLQRLARDLGLGAMEVAVLAAAAAPAFDSGFETLFAYAQNDATRRYPTIGLILDLLTADPLARAEALGLFGPDAPLRAFRLLSSATGDAMAQHQPLTLEPGVLPLLLGTARAEVVLDGALSFESPPDDAPACDLLSRACFRHAAVPLLALLGGPSDSFQRQVAARQAAALQGRLAVLDLAHPAAAALDDATLSALTGRVLRLTDASLFVDTDSTTDVARLARLVRAAPRPGRPVFVAGAVCDHLASLPGCERIEIVLPAPDTATRQACWLRALDALPSGDPALGVRIDPTGAGLIRVGPIAETLGRATRLGPTAIAAAVARARTMLTDRLDLEVLTKASRLQSGPTLARLARLVEPAWSWDDLVLPADQLDELRMLAAAVVQGPRVAVEWGFSAKGLPNPLVALFSGPSGTGKTMAAGLIAQKAGLALFRVDLSAVVSKYIGETEKQLDAVMREASAVGAALLFDEADALFGNRSEVKDARDRYANQEVAFLLQRIEAFDGLVILTTNLSSHIDHAFLRRIAYPVHFPAPDADLREALWRRAFPRQAPLAEELDLKLLARTFEITGGNIRNAALGAAHLAAAGDRAIGMNDVVRAVAREVRKLGRLPSRAEFGALYAALAPTGAAG
jgi:hypothetical protein